MARNLMNPMTVALSLLTGPSLAAETPGTDPQIQAKIRVHSTNRENTFVTVWDVENCEKRSSNRIAILGPKANLLTDRGTRTRIGIPLLEGLAAKQTAEFFAPPGNPYYLEMRQPNIAAMIGSAVTYDWCKVTIKFVPKPGTSYEATYKVLEATDSSKPCTIELNTIADEPGGNARRVPEAQYTLVQNACAE